MKRFVWFTLCFVVNISAASQEVPDLQSQQEAITIVTQLSEHLADLIIHHKQKTNNPEITKEHSIKIIKKLTEIIALCIHKAKTQKTSKSICMYNPQELNTMLEQITYDMIEKIETAKECNL